VRRIPRLSVAWPCRPRPAATAWFKVAADRVTFVGVALGLVKKGSGTVAGTARRVLRTTVPDPFLNQASPRRSNKPEAQVRVRVASLARASGQREMVLNRVATARAIGPKTAAGIWRRSRRSASKRGRAVYLISLHTIYRVLRISLMHLLQSAHQDRSDHFVQHGQRMLSGIFFWSNCAWCNKGQSCLGSPEETAGARPAAS